MWLLGILTAASGGILIFVSPAGMAGVGWTGVGLCCSGGVFLLAAQYLSQDRVHKLNYVRTAVFCASGLAAFSGLVTVISYLGFKELAHSGLLSALGFAGMAGGAAGMVYGYRYHINNSLLELAAELGLNPADSGLTRPDGRYDLKGFYKGVEVLLDGTDIDGNKGRPHCVALDVKCRVGNSSGAWVAAYPEEFGGRPLASLPPVAGPVGYWDWYTVRSEPPDAAERLISLARKRPDTPFQDKDGFKFLELKGQELFCRFERPGYFSEQYVRHLLNGITALAASLE